MALPRRTRHRASMTYIDQQGIHQLPKARSPNELKFEAKSEVEFVQFIYSLNRQSEKHGGRDTRKPARKKGKKTWGTLLLKGARSHVKLRAKGSQKTSKRSQDWANMEPHWGKKTGDKRETRLKFASRRLLDIILAAILAALGWQMGSQWKPKK